MWKRNWVAAKPTTESTLILGLVPLVVFIVAACGADATPFADPTQILIPSTATFTPSPVPPSNTPLAALAAAGEVVSGTLEAATTPSVQQTGDLLAVDPVAAELTALAQRRVAQDLDLPLVRVRVVDVAAYVWTDTSLGCPIPGEAYTTLAVDGYRIVLTVGDNEYIFHTDFDRAIPCDAANEQLPDATPES